MLAPVSVENDNDGSAKIVYGQSPIGTSGPLEYQSA